MANKHTSRLHKVVDRSEDVVQAGMEAGRQAEAEARQQADRMQQVHARLLNMSSAFMTHWLQRRQHAAQAALETAQRAMAASAQPGRLPEIYQDWMNGSLERIAADIRECQEYGTEVVAVMQSSLPAVTGMGENGNGNRRAPYGD